MDKRTKLHLRNTLENKHLRNAQHDGYQVSGIKVGIITPEILYFSPNTWAVWSSQLRAPQE